MKRISRRMFVKNTTAALVGGAMLSSVSHLSAAKKRLPRGIQLYTLREMMAKDVDGTLKQIAAASFQEVEAAGYFGRTAAQFKQAVESAGLHCVSAHHSLGDLLSKEDELIQFVHDIDSKYLVCSSPRAKDPANKELTLDDWKWDFEQFNRLGEKAKAAGLQFGYHNHIGEFRKLDDVLVYDELLRQTDSKLVTMEMDCGWVVVAGYKPLDYLTKYPQRYSLLHVKDIATKDGGKPESTELGRGSIDYKPIFAAAKNIQHYFYEQEAFDQPPLEAIRESAGYLKKLGV
jgi:sugar phosphate isomerase/epimerase